MADDLRGALREAYAVSKGTRCKQFLFSLSLNPPQNATVSEREFRDAIRSVEQRLGLSGQPRAVVFHEKEGRRHAHCVWSRINVKTMTAINLPHFKRKLRDLSRELYIKHDWRMPVGLVDSKERDPTNFTRAEWQQAKRTGLDPRDIKAIFQECWAASDSRTAFANALQERGFWLAKGDRRGFVAVDFRGEVYSVARYADQKTRAINERLGDPNELPSVERTKANIAGRMTANLRGHIRDTEKEYARRSGDLYLRKRDLVREQRQGRERLAAQQEQRRRRENAERAARLPKGLRGLWEWLTGRYGKAKRQNGREAYQAYLRDQTEKQNLVQAQLTERRILQQEIKAAREAHAADIRELYRDVSGYVRMQAEQLPAIREQFQAATQTKRPPIKRMFGQAAENTRDGGRIRRMGDG